MLGVFIGTPQYMQKNWEGVMGKARARMSRRQWLLSQVAFRGRVLLNNFVALSLWHKLAVLTP